MAESSISGSLMELQVHAGLEPALKKILSTQLVAHITISAAGNGFLGLGDGNDLRPKHRG